MTAHKKLDGKILLEIYRRAALIKLNDDQMIKTMKAGKLMMPYYSPRGQEIIPSATMVNLREDDYLCTIYRGTHDMLAKGMPLKELWGELAGRATGTCKGKGGTMHVTYPKMGIMLTTGIVGSSMPIANGLGWASLLDKSGRVTIATFGDGAANIGAFHEALNLASIWKLPVIFLCQNNRYGEHTAMRNCTSVERISDRGRAYSMPGVTVDGNDPDAMYAVAKEAIDRARAGEGPTLIEALTFRFRGHLVGDDQKYIPKKELEEAIANDPLPKLRDRLISEGIANEQDIENMEEAINKEISEAVKLALEADYPAVSEMTTDVYASNA